MEVYSHCYESGQLLLCHVYVRIYVAILKPIDDCMNILLCMYALPQNNSVTAAVYLQYLVCACAVCN